MEMFISDFSEQAEDSIGMLTFVEGQTVPAAVTCGYSTLLSLPGLGTEASLLDQTF